uniref:Phosphoglycerate mutase family protein n=1 Tax=Eutreptiella gymnastica TaxID=73025 RepID=A0A7S1IKD0_9EUGL|mmetsp:Transcript_22702/g.40791  ORF Transcript_22702/g.40791 Transcript_22702/m.40791 type:complete len:241 (+) Transcript_22702:76-798(+)
MHYNPLLRVQYSPIGDEPTNPKLDDGTPLMVRCRMATVLLLVLALYVIGIDSHRLMTNRVATGTPTSELQVRHEESEATKKRTKGQYIVILRHGEKPVDLELNSLSRRGWERSHWLVNWVQHTLPKHTRGSQVSTIMTSMPNVDGLHVRPVQTITPLSVALQMPIVVRPTAFSAANKARRILEEEEGIVLICWQHEDVREMMGYFGFQVPEWSDDDYETVYIIDWNGRRFKRIVEGYHPK